MTFDIRLFAQCKRWILLVVLTGLYSNRTAFCADEVVRPAPLPGTLPGTERLVGELADDEDLSARMRAGFDAFFSHHLNASLERRTKQWKRSFSSRAAYDASIEPNRSRLAEMLGAVEQRVTPPGGLELVGALQRPATLARTEEFVVHQVRWRAFAKVHGEGLLLTPTGPAKARVVWIPDADQIPEQLVGLVPGAAEPQQIPRRLAEAGCEVVVPVLIDRQNTWSGNPRIAMTNMTHREWIYRQAFTMGRHILGYEIEKIEAVIDNWTAGDPADALPIGVGGYFEGGLVALATSAIDKRVDAAWVRGYFQDRQRIWEEPLYRNVFGLLREFGDAEIASLVAPRPLVIEHYATPTIAGPPDATQERRPVAAPGRLAAPTLDLVRAEVERAERFFPARMPVRPDFRWAPATDDATETTDEHRGMEAFLDGLGLSGREKREIDGAPLQAERELPDAIARQQRQVEELVDHTQRLMTRSALDREAFWGDADETRGAAGWEEETNAYRDYLWDRIVGRLPPGDRPLNPRTRQIYAEPKWDGYEVVLDVYDDVFAWGYLLVPKDLQRGERRPVVVCQHGLEGLPADVLNRDRESAAYGVYKGFAAELADRGFVVYAPHNFYRGDNAFRQLQRKAHPLGWTLFGVTTMQHHRHLQWLGTLPFVDAQRIGFYGLSYGGNTAVRVPALLSQYAAVIASGDFNDWIVKNVTTDYIHSMIFHNVYEVFEWNLGRTFNHGDLAALIAPRPFMVERGHEDGVAIDEWVASEYARVRRRYARLGIPERTEIEFFAGPHTINGRATYAFLHRHLHWPDSSGGAAN